MKKFYTPMEELLIEGVKALTTAEIVAAALKTKENFADVLQLDLMLLDMEAKFNMMDGLTYEEWLL